MMAIAGFDPLLAKVIARAADRDACIDRLRSALAEVRLVGVRTNLGFLLDVLDRPEMRSGGIDTDWVTGTWVPEVPPLPAGVYAGSDPTDPWRSFGAATASTAVSVAGRHAQYRGWGYELAVDQLEPVAIAPPGGSLTAPIPGSISRVAVAVGDEVEAGQVAVVLEAMKMQLRVDVPAAGTVRSVNVAVGDVVRAGQSLVEVDDQ